MKTSKEYQKKERKVRKYGTVETLERREKDFYNRKDPTRLAKKTFASMRSCLM